MVSVVSRKWLEGLLCLALIALVVQLGWPAIKAWVNRPQPGKQVIVQVEDPSIANSIRHFLLYLPPGYDDSKQWPLVVFLHGSGQRGMDPELVKRWGIPQQISAGTDYPFLVASPQCPEGKRWNPASITSLIDEVCQEFAVDTNRIYMTGFSMGGFGTWLTAQYAPQRLAAIVPLAGGGNPTEAGLLKDLPVWAFHGGEDEMVPLESSQKMVDAVNAAGGSAKLTIFPTAGHGICEKTYGDPKLWEWLLSQKSTRQFVSAKEVLTE